MIFHDRFELTKAPRCPPQPRAAETEGSQELGPSELLEILTPSHEGVNPSSRNGFWGRRCSETRAQTPTLSPQSNQP